MGQYTAETYRGIDLRWEHKGYFGNGSVEGLFDSLRGRSAIVAGNGHGVFEEFENVSRETNSVVFAANDVGMYLSRVDHFVSLHPTKLKAWVEIRRDKFSRPIGNLDFKVHSHGAPKICDYDWQDLTPLMSLSGYFAAQIAYLMGCEPIILCGCPGDATPRFFETKCENSAYENSQDQIKKEMIFKPEFKRVIRSCSGWSKRFFGGV